MIIQPILIIKKKNKRNELQYQDQINEKSNETNSIHSMQKPNRRNYKAKIDNKTALTSTMRPEL
jgi:hypothetical protein